MLTKNNHFELYFRLLSYLAVLCGFVSLWVSGTFGVIITTVFIVIFIVSLLLENTRLQLSERLGTVLIVLALPLYFLAWKLKLIGFENSEIMIAGLLSRLILSLTLIKLLQKKGERDWIFLYLMAFFEVLLAAGLSISILYLITFLVYLLVTICVIILFEIKKTSRIIGIKNQPKLTSKSSSLLSKINDLPFRKLPSITFSLIVLIIFLAAPIYFLLPRVGGAGFGGTQQGISNLTGFSDSVTLGEIGRIQQNDQVAMRVRLEGKSDNSNLRWRGVALDYFDNKVWSKSLKSIKERFSRDERDVIQIDYAVSRDDIAIQTVYLEPMDTPILFALSRPVTVQGNLDTLTKDSEGSIQFFRRNFERISYKVYSDTNLPEIDNLRKDQASYTNEQERYLKLPPNLDARIAQLSAQVTQNDNNRYDKAKTVEKYLQNNFGYTLEQKAAGDQPIADFLFNVREGHCEYFATAMVVMLRTQGIATRIVNGFQTGDYNETADVFVVRQRNAHSWVEVYFPQEKVWVPFDPTPFAGQTVGNNATTGIIGTFNSYLEALETFWIQYFVAYDNQEQQSLMRSMRNGFVDFQAKSSDWVSQKQEQLTDWWKEARGDKGFEMSAIAIGYGIGYICAVILGVILLIWLYRKIIKSEVWKKIFAWLKRKNETTIVEFYERMQKVLASKGFTRESHQTPLEFAFALNMPEAVSITEKYNRVRFGEKNLSNDEAQEIENWLEKLETANLQEEHKKK
jgi:protein-glutamine gamma-glutamyltransferase